MPGTFKVELQIILDEASEAKVIELARRWCERSTGTSVHQPGEQPSTGLDAGIADTSDAILEVFRKDPTLARTGVQIKSASCRAMPSQCDLLENATTIQESWPSVRSADDGNQQGAEYEEDLDEFDSGFYLCRWPNGEFSVVKADTKREAILELDEWDGAEPSWLVPMETCMIDFRLNDQAEIELRDLSEETAGFIWETCYPRLDALLSRADVQRHRGGETNPRLDKEIKRAVAHERKRLWKARGGRSRAKTALGRELQKRLGTVGPVADHYVQNLADGIMRGKSGEDKKPN